MAETDRLELEIATKINKNGAEKVAALAKAIRSLNSAVTHFKTTNFSAAVSQMSDSLKDFLATAKNSEKSLVALASILKKASPKKAAQTGAAADTAIPAVSEVKEQLTLLDVYKKRLEEIQNDLKNQNLTTEQRNVLLAQELDYQEKIKNYQPMDSSNPENQKSLRETQLFLEKISLAYQNIAIIEKQIAAGNVSEEKKNSLLDKRASKLLQIEKWLTKIEALQSLAPLGTETIDTGDEVDTTPAPQIKPEDNALLDKNVLGHRLLASAIKDENKEKEKSGKNGNKLSLKELAASIKRVAVYRAIRAVLKDVSSAMQNAFSYASQNLPEFNQSFSQIKSSLAVINGSVGVLATALLPIIQPLLTGIASVMATIANSISKASAALRGQNTYLKVNKDYWKDQKDQMNGSLLAFDTFTTLSQQTADMTGLFKNAEMTNEEMKATANKARTILTVVISIGAALAAIKALKILDGVKDTLKNVKKIDGKTATIYATIAAISFLVVSIISVIKNPDLTGWQKFAALLTGALATAIAIMAVIQFTKWGWKGAIIAGAFAGGAMTLASAAVATKFADGGMFEGAGTMYAIAGESGAEVVAKGSQGTGVLNVEQFKTAMVQAFYEYGAARGDLSAASVTLNGEKVGKMTASSSYREMVRQGLL